MEVSMGQSVSDSLENEPAEQEGSSLSYKFQRLREKLRTAIASGELAGKLPGERTLARRFHVNAKTLSKALTDLAAEGLLDRSIGRGTYVKGSGPVAGGTKRWLVICDAKQGEREIINLLRASQPDLETVTDVSSLRPSFLNQFNAVIDLAKDTPDSLIRDLVVRNVGVILVGKEPRIYSTHSVAFDIPLAVSQIGRKLVLSGHRSLAAIEPPQCSIVLDSLGLIVSRYSSDIKIDACSAGDVATMVEHGVTAFVCHSVDLALEVKAQLEKAGISVPQQASVAAVGCISGQQPISGFFVQWSEKSDAIVRLLKDQQSSRPTTIWLAGQYVDGGTVAPPEGQILGEDDIGEDTIGKSSSVRHVM